MSTKIYEAWKMPVNAFQDQFLPSFRSRCLRKVTKQVELLMDRVRPQFIKSRKANLLKAFKSDPDRVGNLEAYADRVARFDHVEEAMEEASLNRERDLDCCVDASLVVFLDNREHHKGLTMVYCIPFGESWIWDGFNASKSTGGMAREYAYWNNADKPDEVTAKEWRERKRHWERFLEDWNGLKLTHTVFDLGRNVGGELIRRKILPGEYRPPTGGKK